MESLKYAVFLSMNLGTIHLEAFAAIAGLSLVIAILVASLLRLRRWSWRNVFVVALPLWLAIGCYALSKGHQPAFAEWHKWQNSAPPRNGCLTYEPSFTRLYASYRMSRDEFTAWVANHPWRLRTGDMSLLYLDGDRLHLAEPELSYETDRASNGQQLRVYYKSGVMYVSYNSM
jgi:hypothetical protein